MLPFVLRFQPIVQQKIWGYESWEVSDFFPYLSQISNGDSKGLTFRELYTSKPKEILGDPFVGQPFPLLLKWIHTKDKLSVQVHPDERYSQEKDPDSQGKTEAWIVLDHKPTSELAIGFHEKIDRKTFESLVLANRGEEPLRKWKVKSGDSFLLEPGTIHAIGADIGLLEVQQSSDSTYRVYDYGRTDAQGNTRALHLNKALDVIRFEKSTGEEQLKTQLLHLTPFERILLSSHKEFRLESWQFYQGQFLSLEALSNPVSFAIFYVTRGSLFFPETGETFRAGETFFVTASGMSRGLRPFVESRTSLAVVGAGTKWVAY